MYGVKHIGEGEGGEERGCGVKVLGERGEGGARKEEVEKRRSCSIHTIH